MNLLFNSDKVNLLFKNSGGRDRRSNFVIFVVWSALIVGGWVVLTWSKKSCLGLAEISPAFCVSGLIQVWGKQDGSKISSFCF